MKVQMTYNGKTVEVEVADEQFEKLFVDKKTGYEKVSATSYWHIDSDGVVLEEADYNTYSARCRYKFANYFSDKTVAENMARAQRLWNNIHRRAVELCKPVNVSQKGTLYHIVFKVGHNRNNIVHLSRFDTRSFGTVWFDTEEHCKQVIEEFHDELLWYFTEFKDRADM